jgi:hypothetical protein
VLTRKWAKDRQGRFCHLIAIGHHPLLAMKFPWSAMDATAIELPFGQPTLKKLRPRFPGAAMEEGGKMKAIWQLLSIILLRTQY